MPLDKEWGFRVVDKLREISEQHNASPAQVAIAWLLAQHHVSTDLLGASKMLQLEDNLGAVSLTLSPDELATLDQLTKPQPIYPNWFTEFSLDQQTKDALNTK